MTRAPALRRPIAAGLWFSLAGLAFGAPESVKADSDVDANHWTLGAGMAMEPPFQGSDDYELQPLPLVDVEYGRFFAKFGEGIGLDIIETPTFTAGASVDWMRGYDENDVPDGIHGVDGALGARLFGSARFNGVVATLAATQAVSETERGLVVDLGLAYPIRATGRLMITPSLGTTWANEKYMNSYFGIDSSESAASGLGQYQPTSSFKDIYFSLNARYRLTDSISALGSIGVTHLIGNAADSPLVKQETQPIVMMGLAYTF